MTAPPDPYASPSADAPRRREHQDGASWAWIQRHKAASALAAVVLLAAAYATTVSLYEMLWSASVEEVEAACSSAIEERVGVAPTGITAVYADTERWEVVATTSVASTTDTYTCSVTEGRLNQVSVTMLRKAG